jgi:hypothetical protein
MKLEMRGWAKRLKMDAALLRRRRGQRRNLPVRGGGPLGTGEPMKLGVCGWATRLKIEAALVERGGGLSGFLERTSR